MLTAERLFPGKPAYHEADTRPMELGATRPIRVTRPIVFPAKDYIPSPHRTREGFIGAFYNQNRESRSVTSYLLTHDDQLQLAIYGQPEDKRREIPILGRAYYDVNGNLAMLVSAYHTSPSENSRLLRYPESIVTVHVPTRQVYLFDTLNDLRFGVYSEAHTIGESFSDVPKISTFGVYEKHGSITIERDHTPSDYKTFFTARIEIPGGRIDKNFIDIINQQVVVQQHRLWESNKEERTA